MKKWYAICFLMCVQQLLFSQAKAVPFFAESDSVSLYSHAVIAYADRDEVSLRTMEKLDFHMYADAVLQKMPMPDTLQYAVIRFSLQNFQNKPLYLTAKEEVSYMQVYELRGGTFRLVGKTGYANRISEASIKYNERQVILHPMKNQPICYVVVLKKYKYMITIPEIIIESEDSYLKAFENRKSKPLSIYALFTVFITGFQFALLIFGIFRMYLLGFKKIYFFFSLQCLLFIVFYLNEIHVLVFEVDFLPFITNKMVYEALGDLFIVVFNFLIISFFDLNKKNFLYRFLVGITIFWVILFFVEALPFIGNILVIRVFRFILNTAAIVDFITLALVFSFALRHRQGFRRYLFVGILVAMISSFEVALPRFLNLIHLDPNWIKISDASYFLLQICDNINFCFFFISFILKEKEVLAEKQLLEAEHLQSVAEIKKLRSVTEKENIILKDKTKINLDTLLYIKADDHYLNVYTVEKKQHMVRGKLSEIMEELPSNFVKCHRSYIINKNYIRQIQSRFLVMSDNSEIPVSRGFKI